MSGLHVICATGKGEVRLLKKIKQGVKCNDKVAIITPEESPATITSLPVDEKDYMHQQEEQPNEAAEKCGADDTTTADTPAGIDSNKGTDIESYLKGITSRLKGNGVGSKDTSRQVSAVMSSSKNKLNVLGGAGGKIVGEYP